MSGIDPALVVRYQVKLEQPLLATALAGDPNEGVSFDYVPGSLLRGALIGKYSRQRGSSQLADCSDPDVQRLFFNGSTRFLNAYPSQGDQRLLPVPRSIQHPKGQPSFFTDAATAPPDDEIGTVWKGATEPFGWLHADEDHYEDNYEGELRLHAPQRQIWVHSTRTRRYGRAMPRERLIGHPHEFEGTVYRYDSLAPEQIFTGLILCQTSQDAAELWNLIGGFAMLGGARSAGYGKVQLLEATLESEGPENAENWRESGAEGLTQSLESGSELCLTLLSDWLLRDANGQMGLSLHALNEELGHHLGDIEIVPEKTFLSSTVVGGFNNKWGLPLPQTLAVAMGSVLTVRANAAISLDQLEALENKGVGERRADGFGRVAVNWHTAPEWTVREFDADEDSAGEDRASEAPASALDEMSLALAQKMVARMLQQRLEDRVLELAYGTNYQVIGLRSKSQIARLRGVIARQLAQSSPAPSQVTAFIEDIKSRTSAKRQFERMRLKHNHQPLLDRLRELLNCSESQWDTLFNAARLQTVTVAGEAASLTPALRTEYLLRFIDAILLRAVKESPQLDSSDQERGED